jgi:hypothetical protein
MDGITVIDLVVIQDLTVRVTVQKIIGEVENK